jgi:hypothetical protein
MLLAVGAVAMAGGALIRSPIGFVALAVAFGAFQLATVAAETRLQHAVTGRARSTVTSISGLGTDLAAIAVVALYGAGSTRLEDATLFALFAVPYLVLAGVPAARAARRRPSRPR